MTRSLLITLLLALFLPTVALAQNAPNESVATCSLENGNEVAIRYQPVKASGEKPEFGSKIPYGAAWAPNNRPLVMFTTGPLTAGNKALTPGAYTLFLIPNKNEWTLVVSSQTDTNAKYDSSKDLVRMPMELGALPNSQPDFKVILGHTGPNECSMRIYWQKQGGFATFTAK